MMLLFEYLIRKTGFQILVWMRFLSTRVTSRLVLGDFCVGSLFSLSEVFHFLEGSSVPRTELRVPSSGDLKHSLIGDPRSGNNLCTQVNRGCSFSAGSPQAGPRSIDLAILGTTQARTHSEPSLEKFFVRGILGVFEARTLCFEDKPECCGDEGVPIGEDRNFLRLKFLEPGKWGSSSMSVSRFVFMRGLFPSTRISRDHCISTWVLILQVVELSSRLRVAPTESMDSSDSSLDLTAKVENPRAIVASRTSQVGGVDILRLALLRVSDFGVDEVPVYEGYFASGFRDRIPSLVATISETQEISPGQLNPPALRTQIALQNLGDLNGLVIGVAELHSGFATSLRDVALASFALHGFGARCTHIAPSWSLQFLKVVDGMLGPERVRYVPPQGRSRSQRLLDPASLARSRSCSYRNEMPSGLMMFLREVTPG
ncbi:hypothetical protein F2Q69_00013516 [Brassica cretica]|uniref:Uncharacterized protein n=1 Tax=Brassica cretica TaxID=69181 RepID=A0A8S9R2U7_BRACR|nr:hypothetical protein F2Q69_00013516 [Brassica cretica]